ncbi:MAG: 4-alpha-glucanotransferase [Candidatus Velamenicoccus archaeovorus]
MTSFPNYTYLLSTITADQWKRIGIHRRAGVVVPLFSVYSAKSTGIGELPDIHLLVDWCKACGMSIIQLLPMNDTGFDFRPYDAQSMFALDPLYLRLEKLKGADIKPFLPRLLEIKDKFPAGRPRVDYQIKKAKLDLLWDIFSSISPEGADGFGSFLKDNAFWIEDYALFKVIKERNGGMGWEGWPEDLKNRGKTALQAFREAYRQNILFHQWLQWQLFEQFRDARSYAQKNNVLLMGDIPFLVSRDSADVWSHQDCFKLDLSSGAPPDLLYSKGQRWGMPPFNWDRIAHHRYDYVIEKLKYAQNFYDLYRIDHVVGIFRVWTIPLSEPPENGGLNGAFDPADENTWEKHGKDLLTLMVKHSSMLACAEDLGTVPNCCFKVLNEMGIPGIDVQRWMREWGKSYAFKSPEDYRKCALATIATHDMSNLCAWWDFECGTVDEALFRRNCEKKNIAFDRIKETLFDTAASRHGRLRWKQEIDTEEKLLGVLGTTPAEGWALLDMYRGSFKEKRQFLQFLGLEKENPDSCSTTFIKNALTKIQESACIFGIQLIQDYLDLDQLYEVDPWENRINFPGTLSEKNWTLVLPLSLDDILALPINSVLKSINEACGRR